MLASSMPYGTSAVEMRVRIERRPLPLSRLRSRRLLLVVLGECFACLCEALEQRCWCQKFTLLLFESADTLVPLLKSDRVAMPHRPTAVSREAIAVDINNV